MSELATAAPVEATSSRLRADPSPAPIPALSNPPGQAASVAHVRGARVGAELAALAAELGIGQDLALERAIALFRKLCKRGRRAGRGPEALFREMVEVHEQRALRAEIDEMKARMTEMRETLVAATQARRGFAAVSPSSGSIDISPVALFRQVRLARANGRGSRPAAANPVDPPATTEQPITREAHPQTVPSAHNALLSVAAAANDGAAQRPEPEIIFTPISAEPSGEAKLDYAQRRSRVPKITF